MNRSPFKSSLKTLVIIDGFHLNTLARKHNINIEFKVLRDLLDQSPVLSSPKYYTPVQMTSSGTPANNVSSLLSWLAFNGYDVTTQNVYQLPTEVASETKYSISHVLMRMCIDVVSLYNEQGYGRLLLMAGSQETVPFLQYLRKFGVQIDVLSSVDLGLLSPEVRSNCDHFYEFTEFAPLFYRMEEPTRQGTATTK